MKRYSFPQSINWDVNRYHKGTMILWAAKVCAKMLWRTTFADHNKHRDSK